ncbi:MAG: hypothetical protein KGH69_02700 [Candidatus Micrarchaeota archaeon]|nr:hypothetical protein [Candidatus Micrarchaeota archaeon]
MAALRGREPNDRVIQSLFRNSSDPSSFGPIGYIGQAGDSRLKGLVGYTERPLRAIARDTAITPITDARGVEFVSNVASIGKQMLRDQQRTRLTFRTLATRDAVKDIRQSLDGVANVEAVIPVNEPYSMVYVGFNAADRTLERNSQERARELTRSAEYRQTLVTMAERVFPVHYSTIIYPIDDRSVEYRFSAEHREQVTGLLRSFGHTSESATTVLRNPNVLLGVATTPFEETNEVVGICIAERVNIRLNTGDALSFVEITDAKVREDHQGNGIYYDLSTAMINDIITDHMRGSRQTDLIFAESNLQNTSLIKTALLQGRSFTGLLQNHVSIDGNLKDFAVTYLQGGSLATTISEVVRH